MAEISVFYKATISQSTPSENKDVSKLNEVESPLPTDAKGFIGLETKECGGEKLIQINDVPLHSIQNKWQTFAQFSEELDPIIKQLNGLMEKYEIYNPDNFLSFLVIDFKWSVFVNYSTFPPIQTPEKPVSK